MSTAVERSYRFRDRGRHFSDKASLLKEWNWANQQRDTEIEREQNVNYLSGSPHNSQEAGSIWIFFFLDSVSSLYNTITTFVFELTWLCSIPWNAKGHKNLMSSCPKCHMSNVDHSCNQCSSNRDGFELQLKNRIKKLGTPWNNACKTGSFWAKRPFWF